MLINRRGATVLLSSVPIALSAPALGRSAAGSVWAESCSQLLFDAWNDLTPRYTDRVPVAAFRVLHRFINRACELDYPLPRADCASFGSCVWFDWPDLRVIVQGNSDGSGVTSHGDLDPFARNGYQAVDEFVETAISYLDHSMNAAGNG